MVATIVKQFVDYNRDTLGGHTLADPHGFPISYFAGAWYFTHASSGTEYGTGSAAAGPFLDITGNGNHASIVLSATPTKQSWGIQVTDVDGIYLSVPILFPESGVAIIALEDTVSSAVGHHTSWLRPNVNLPAAKGDSVSNWVSPQPAMTTTDPAATPGGVIYSNTHGILDIDGTILTDVRVRIPSWRLTASGHAVLACRWNNTTGTMELFSLPGGAWIGFQDAALISYWDAWSALTTVIGLHPFGPTRPTTGNIYGAALATTALNQDIIWAAMNALSRKLYFTGGGLLMQGYVPPTI